MKIKQENLSSAMDHIFKEKKDWVQSFNVLKIHYLNNFESLFVYNLIRKQVDIKEFQLVVKEIVNNSEPWQLKGLYNSFFNTSITLGIGKYLEQNRYDNNFGDIQNMRHIFLTRENNKITLEKTSIEYLKAIFLSQPSSLVESGVALFFYDFTENLPALKPVLEALQNSPDGNKVLIPLFHAISTMSYDLPESVNKTSYNVLVESVPNIQKEFENNLVYQHSNSEPGVQLNPSLMNFLSVCQADGLSMINNRYQEEYEKLLQTPVDVSNKPAILHTHYKEEPFVKLAISLSSGIRMKYKADSPLDLAAININESALKNFVYLKALEVKLNNNEPIQASLALCNYISAIYKREKEEVMPSIGSFLDLEMLDKKLLYSRLGYSLEAKPATTKKPKI